MRFRYVVFNYNAGDNENETAFVRVFLSRKEEKVKDVLRHINLSLEKTQQIPPLPTTLVYCNT